MTMYCPLCGDELEKTSGGEYVCHNCGVTMTMKRALYIEVEWEV